MKLLQGLAMPCVAGSLALAATQAPTIPESLARAGTSLQSGASMPSGAAPAVDRVLEQTDVIVRGTVGQPRSYLSDDLTEVLSDYPLSDAEVLYARSELRGTIDTASFAATIHGGVVEINHLTFSTAHAGLPRLNPGSRAVLCLQKDGARFMIALRFFGAFEITGDELVPTTTKTGFAPEMRGVPMAQALAALVTRAGAVHRRVE